MNAGPSSSSNAVMVPERPAAEGPPPARGPRRWRFTLRARLFLGLLPFVVILVAMGAYAVALFSRLAGSENHAVAGNYQSILAVQGMAQALSAMDDKLHSAAGFETVRSPRFEQERLQFEKNLSTQYNSPGPPGVQELNAQLAAGYRRFLESLRPPRRVLRAPKEQRPPPPVVGADVPQMKATLQKIRTLNYRAILDTNRDIQETARQVTRVVLAGTLVVLLLSVCTFYHLSRSILRPIRLLTRATRELGKGRRAAPVRVRSRDELGELAGSFNNMAAQLEEYRQSASDQILRLHRAMETTLASFPDPIFVLNRDGRIELRNPAAEQLAAALHLNGGLPDVLQTIARKTLESGQNFLPHGFDEAIAYRVAGAEKSFLPRVLAMRDKQNVLFGVAVVLHDVTRFRLLDAAKSNLVAAVSHELKTPLTSLRMALHLLLERNVGALTPQQDELLQAARDDTERLLRILNDLLDLARLEEGEEGLRKEPVSPMELLRVLIEQWAEEIAARGLRVNCVIEPELPRVAVDRQRVGHVFSNLVANAIKYSPPDGEIRLGATRADNSSVEFTVSDQGPGIAEEYQARVFDRFFRAPGQTKSGAGLGLSIARDITLAHGGRIGVRSSPGRGSTFFVVLPRAQEPDRDYC